MSDNQDVLAAQENRSLVVSGDSYYYKTAGTGFDGPYYYATDPNACYTDSFGPLPIPRSSWASTNSNYSYSTTLTPKRFTLSGQVKDPSGNIVSGATATFNGSSTTTNASGYFYFYNVPASGNTRSVSISKAGYYATSATVASDTCTPISTPVTLTPITYTLSGYVRDATGSAGISGAYVSFGGYGAYTNASGYYTITGIPRGTSGYTNASAAYYSNGTYYTGALNANSTNGVIYLNRNNYTLSGKVQTASGVGIPYASVSYAGYNTTANSSGNYSITVPYLTSGNLTASAPGYNSSSPVSITMNTGNRTNNITLSPLPTYTLTVTAQDATNTAVKIPGVTVSFNGTNGSTNSSGVYSGSFVQGTSGTVTLSAPGYNTYTYSVSSMTSNVNIIANMTKSVHTVSGNVKDSLTGNGVPGATVQLGSYTATTDANGNYTITGVPYGTSGAPVITKAGYNTTTGQNLTVNGNMTNANYTLVPVPTNTGKILTPGGAPIPNAGVTCTDPAGNTAGQFTTDANGDWAGALPTLPDGQQYNCVLTSTPPGYQPNGTPDSTAPQMTIEGDMTVFVGDKTTDPLTGVTTTDNINTDLVPVVSGWDTSKVGTYTVTYTATDGAQNVTTGTRKLTVVSPNIDLKTIFDFRGVVLPGSTVPMGYDVTNTSVLPLTGVNVTNDLNSSISCPKTVLQPNEKMSCTTNVLIPRS